MSPGAQAFIIAALCGFICIQVARVRGRNTYIALAVGAVGGVLGVLGYTVFVYLVPPRDPPAVDPFRVWSSGKLRKDYGLDDDDGIPPRPDL